MRWTLEQCSQEWQAPWSLPAKRTFLCLLHLPTFLTSFLPSEAYSLKQTFGKTYFLTKLNSSNAKPKQAWRLGRRADRSEPPSDQPDDNPDSQAEPMGCD